MENMKEKIESIETKDAFIDFLRSLIQDYREGKVQWENQQTDSFLEALASWTEDMEGYYSLRQTPLPEEIPWRIFADCLMGATMYE